jgi:drug/metabolite transporter (DMT)-like permease
VTERRTWVAFIGVIVSWGSSYLFIRLALQSWNAYGLVATRFGLAAVLCWAIARVRGERFPRGSQLLALLVVGVMMMSGSNALTALAQRTVSSGLSGVVHSLGSVWLAALGALPMLRSATPKRPRPSFWFGVIGGVIGVAVLLWPGERGLEASMGGVLLLLTSTFIFAIASLVQRTWQVRGPQVSPTPLFAQLAVQMLGGASVALVVALASGGLMHDKVTAPALFGMAWLTVVASIIGFASFATVLRGWPPARAGSYAVINPIVSVLLGVLFAGEQVTANLVLGSAITLLSVAWVQWCHR